MQRARRHRQRMKPASSMNYYVGSKPSLAPIALVHYQSGDESSNDECSKDESSNVV